VKPSNVTAFRGLNTTADPLRLGLGWLSTANNVNVRSDGAIEAREGYSLHAAGTSITSAFSSADFQRAWYVDSGTVKTLAGANVTTITSTAYLHWAEVNRQAFYNNGVDSGIILGDNSVIPWRWTVPSPPTLAAVAGTLDAGLYRVVTTFILPDGRETGPSDPSEIELVDGQALQISGIHLDTPNSTRVYIAPANSSVFQLASYDSAAAMVWNAPTESLGFDLATDGMDPLPMDATVIAFWSARAYAAQYMAGDGMSALWHSQPMGFHLFDLSTDFHAIPGEIVMLAPTPSALVIGTRTEIYALTAEGLQLLADYGTVPGRHWATDAAGSIVFWTLRGMCRAMPFTNLTQGHLSVAPGVQAGASVIERDGQRRFVVSLHRGGTAFNQRI